MISRLPLAAVLLVSGATLVAAGQQSPAQPVPRPFPGATPPPATTTPSKPAEPSRPPASQTSAPAPPPVSPAPAAEPLPPGVPVYPAAEFLEAVDAGRGQKYYLFGTNASYVETVTFYKTQLKASGRELSKMPAPPMQQFDLGRFQEESMAYPPSVVVKDYTWNGSEGYLFVVGVQEKRYKTIIQIVPATAK
jgi:hypothetical protein